MEMVGSALILMIGLGYSERLADGRILGVKSGDTFMVAFPNTYSRKVRIWGIEAPVEGQPGFEEAREFLWALRNTAVELDVVKHAKGGTLVGNVRFVEPGRQSLLYTAYLRSGLVW